MLRKCSVALFALLFCVICTFPAMALPVADFSVESADLPTCVDQAQTAAVASELFDGFGTEDAPYLITSAEDLLNLSERINAGDADYLTAYYRQSADICLTGTPFAPIGTETSPFAGVYDGDGYRIEYHDAVFSGNTAGIFGYANNAGFANMTVDLVGTAENATGVDAGAVCAYYKANVKYQTFDISRCRSFGSLTVTSREGTSTVGGLFGRVLATDNCVVFMSDCMSTMDVTSNGYTMGNAGGLVGEVVANVSGFVSLVRCYTENTVSATSKCYFAHCGGITGGFDQDTNSWSDWQDVSGSANAASLSSEDAYNFKDCFTASALSVHAGMSSGNNIGWLSSYVLSPVKTTNSYHLQDESVVTTINAENGTAVTERAALFDQAFLTETLGFDLENVWLHLGSEELLLRSRLKQLYITEVGKSEVTVLPVNCAAGQLIAAYRDSDGAFIGTSFISYDGTEHPITVAVPEIYASRAASTTFYLLDLFTLRPLVAASGAIVLG